MENKMTKKEYSDYVDQKSHNSNLGLNIVKAFLVGGLICIVGQAITDTALQFGASAENAGMISSMVLVLIASILTGLNVYDRIGKFGGAGSAVQITGFANSIVSPAMEFKSEGFILGVGSRMFVVAGPVLVYGVSTSIIYGIILVLLGR